jgi:pimeloyl-ACP methyl ester carboxylesterase
VRNYPTLLMVLVAGGLAARPARAADEAFDSNGVKIRYVTLGAGEPVVLIHGWMSDSSMWGRDLFGNTKLKAADGYRLIALDCRGHGKSDKPHEVEKYGPEMAADVVRLLDHLGIERAHLVGYSSGAFIAGKVAATHPGRVLSVVYGGQAPLIKRPRPAGSAGAEPPGDSETEIFARAVDRGKNLGPYIMAVWPADKPKLTEEQANAIAKVLYDGKDVKAFAAAGRGFKNLGVTEDQLKRCAAPVLFIHGGNESRTVKDSVATVRNVLGRGEVKVIEGGDHLTTLARPEFASAISEFLRSGKPK